MVLEARWLGRVRYADGYALQHSLFSGSSSNYLLLLEHPHVFTLGVRADRSNILVNPTNVAAEQVDVDRGGDVTYHGPGQLVGYPIINLEFGKDMTPRYVHTLEEAVIQTLLHFGIVAGRLEGYPGVWVDPSGCAPRKIAAIGVKVSRNRSMHGFALNVATQMEYFDYIVPCGLAGMAVTSMAEEGVVATPKDVAAVVVERFAALFDFAEMRYVGLDQSAALSDFSRGVVAGGVDAKLSSLNRRLMKAGVDPDSGLKLSQRKPEWLRLRANMGEEYRELKSMMRKMSLVTVCEEAGCPNIFECWQQGTATFMINGASCTRACGFCLVDTNKPLPLDPLEPGRVAAAVKEMGLSFAVVTAVARDDLEDGGARGFANTIDAIHQENPGVGVEVLIPDFKGSADSLELVFAARPEVLNHNVETPLRLQRAVRPSASYARSLSVLARAKAAGLTTKSGIMVGIGEEFDELLDTLRDLRAVGVDIVTIGQYLRPTSNHLPISRYYEPEEFGALRTYAEGLGFSHVESSPMARSSYHAKAGAESALGMMV